MQATLQSPWVFERVAYIEKSTSPLRLIGAMCLAETVGMIGIFAFPALLPRFFELWSLTNTQAGWINGIYFAGYTLAVAILVSLTDRIDARKIYLASSVLGVVAALAFALFANGFWTALVFRGLAGLSLAGTYIPGLRALVDRVQGKAQARAVSFYTATFSLGVGLSFFANGQLDAWFGWRWAFAVGAVGSALALLLALIVLQPKTPQVKNTQQTHLLNFKPVLRNSRAMAYILAYAAHTWELFAFRSWIVAYLAFSLTLQPAYQNFLSPSSVAALTSLIAMWASVGGAELAVQYGRRRTLNIIMGGSALFAVGIGFAATVPYPILIILFILYASFVQGDSAAIHAGVVQSAEKERLGVTMAFQSVIGFATAFLGPLVFGLLLDLTGSGQTVGSWGAAFIATGLAVATGPVFLAVLLPDPRNFLGQS